MRYKECQIVWTPASRAGDYVSSRPNPTIGKVEVIPHPARGQGRDYIKSLGACYGYVKDLSDEQVLTHVFADFVKLVRDDRMDIDRVHRAFMDIDEYRDVYLAEPLMGPGRTFDPDPVVTWGSIELHLAEFPTWDEAVQTVAKAARVAPSDGDKLRLALADAVARDTAQGSLPRFAVQALRLALDFCGVMNIDRAIAKAAEVEKILDEA